MYRVCWILLLLIGASLVSACAEEGTNAPDGGDASGDADTDSASDSETNSDPTVADECYDGTFYIQDQDDAQYCWQFPCITGSLYVAAELAVLSLPNLAEVDGSVVVEDGADVGLLALPALTAIGGDLLLSWGAGAIVLPALTTVGGTAALGAVTPSIDLPALQAVGEDLSIVSGLAHTVGLPQLVTVGGDLRVTSEQIAFLNAPNLETIGGHLSLCPVPQLTGTDLFASLHSLGGGLHLHHAQLTSLDGAGTLPAIPGDLHLADNSALASMSALAGVTTIGGAVEIVGNDALPYCVVCELLALLDALGGAVDCRYNLPDDCGDAEIECAPADGGVDGGG